MNLTTNQNPRRLPIAFALAATVALASLSAPASAVQLHCNLKSMVRDAATLERIPGAAVRVVDTRTNWDRTRMTNHRGIAHHRAIRPDGGDSLGWSKGHQLVEVSAPGYVSQRFEGVECPLGLTQVGRFQLVKEG